MSGSCRTKNTTTHQTKAGRRKLYTFSEARKIARSYGFHSQDEFVEYECAGSYQLPKNVDEIYESEWRGWGDFLGIPLPFAQAKKVAKSLHLMNKEEYLRLKEKKTGKSVDDDDFLRLPYRPDLYYKEWSNWEDWLGV